MAKWELETGGTLGEGSEQSPVVYPRSDEAREGTLVENTEVSDGNDTNDEAGGNADQQ